MPAPELDMAREWLYRFVAMSLTDPSDDNWFHVLDPENQRLACAAADVLRKYAQGKPISLAPGEMAPESLELESACAFLQRPLEEMRDEYDRVAGLTPARECPPFETEYHTNSEPFFRSQQMADVAGFYRAFGLNPSLAAGGRPDYLPLELEFMAFLLMKRRLIAPEAEVDSAAQEALAVCAKAEIDFFRDHLAWWVPAFASGLRQRAGTGFYAELGRVLAALVAAERLVLGVSAPRISLGPVLVERAEDATECGAVATP